MDAKKYTTQKQAPFCAQLTQQKVGSGREGWGK